MRPTSVSFLAATVVATACGEASTGSPMEGSWRATVDTVGDTVVVRTIGGSEWGRARLVEEVRIGRVEGEEHEMFGRVGALAVTPAGDVLIYDAQATALRRYGPDGSYRGTVGRAGSGPGEYRNVAGMAVLENGRIVLNDFGNGRFTLFTPNGEPHSTWPVGAAIAAMRPVHTYPGGGLFLHDARRRAGGAGRDQVLVRLDDRGRPGDTLLIPHTDYRPRSLQIRSAQGSAGLYLPFAATAHWSITADGHLVTMIGDRYRVDVHRPDGTFLRIERDVEPVPVSPPERAAEEERVMAFFRAIDPAWTWDGPSIPASKPPLRWLHTGQDSTIWVRISQPGSVIPEAQRGRGARTFVREPLVLEVFDGTGRFLGKVHAPDGLQLQPHPVLDRDHVWAVVRDENDVDFVARFRVVRD